ncbi:hypothetical protein [Paraburkholderia kururiensis]|uniref:hypothetical protein n=1 Tax=Paraburkholderia kururiensis TaxID=984307 RepID=UPI0018F74679|nr:hypothetical protein [Paraburkholderia kururiensis]
MNKFDMLKWQACDSRSDMEARTTGAKVVGTLQTSDANAWGYICTPDGWHLKIGYANIGLVPQAVLVGQSIFVGINECLAGYDLSVGVMRFSYRMPLVFHEFIDVSDSLIVRDEMGFVCMAQDGRELWKFITEGVVDSYEITASTIRGCTVDGLEFSFVIPNSTPKD